MNEELKEKLKKILAEKGIDEAVSEEIVVELDGEPQATPETLDQPIEEQGEAVETEVEEEPAPEEGEVLPVEDAPVEAVPEVPAEEPAPELPPEPQEPEFDFRAELQSMKDENEELRKTNEALLARLDSLEDALRGAGVLEGEKKEKPIGFHKDEAPDKDPLDDGLDSFFSRVNRGR